MSTATPLANLESELHGLILRVKTLETEVAQLKQKSAEAPAATSDRVRRWESVLGSMKDDPEFAEVLRLGREYRKSHFTD